MGNELIKEETKALIKQLESEQGNLSQYTDQQERALKMKADYEQKLVLAGQKLVQIEQEKTNRDHTIRHLNDEIANQDEVINKLNKEKKHMAEVSAKANEDLQTAGDKVDHLANIKSKLESTLD